MTAGPHVKYPNFLSDFNEINNPQIYNVMKIRPMGTELLHVEGQTDRHTDTHDEANSLFFFFFLVEIWERAEKRTTRRYSTSQGRVNH